MTNLKRCYVMIWYPQECALNQDNYDLVIQFPFFLFFFGLVDVRT